MKVLIIVKDERGKIEKYFASRALAGVEFTYTDNISVTLKQLKADCTYDRVVVMCQILANATKQTQDTVAKYFSLIASKMGRTQLLILHDKTGIFSDAYGSKLCYYECVRYIDAPVSCSDLLKIISGEVVNPAPVSSNIINQSDSSQPYVDPIQKELNERLQEEQQEQGKQKFKLFGKKQTAKTAKETAQEHIQPEVKEPQKPKFWSKRKKQPSDTQQEQPLLNIIKESSENTEELPDEIKTPDFFEEEAKNEKLHNTPSDSQSTMAQNSTLQMARGSQSSFSHIDSEKDAWGMSLMNQALMSNFGDIDLTAEQQITEQSVPQPIQQPVYEQPIQQPVYEQPIQQPVYEQPIQQPTYEQPIQQPTYEQPIQQPTNEQPIQQPTYEQPIQQPTKPVKTKHCREKKPVAKSVASFKNFINLCSKRSKLYTVTGDRRSGASEICSNLAAVCAKNGLHTLIIDFDITRNGQYHTFRLNIPEEDSRSSISLAHVLDAPYDVEQYATNLNTNLSLIGIAPSVGETELMLKKCTPEKLRGLLTIALSTYDVVFIDVPFDTFCIYEEFLTIANVVIMPIEPDYKSLTNTLNLISPDNFTNEMGYIMFVRKLSFVINKYINCKVMGIPVTPGTITGILSDLSDDEDLLVIETLGTLPIVPDFIQYRENKMLYEDGKIEQHFINILKNLSEVIQ